MGANETIFRNLFLLAVPHSGEVSTRWVQLQAYLKLLHSVGFNDKCVQRLVQIARGSLFQPMLVLFFICLVFTWGGYNGIKWQRVHPLQAGGDTVEDMCAATESWMNILGPRKTVH